MGGADDLELVTRNRQIDFLVELGDISGADSALRALELTVSSSADPRTEGYAYLQRARQAVIEGRYAEAERLNTRAVHVGQRLSDTNMVILAANQVAGIRWTQGRLVMEAAADPRDDREGRHPGLAGRARARGVRGGPRGRGS